MSGNDGSEAISPYSSEDQPQLPEEDVEDEGSVATSASKPPFRILTTPQLEQWMTLHNQIDVGCAGSVVWSVSSAKHGNGVRHLMQYHDLNTFWQSDGVLPHVIRIRLSQLTPVEAIALYMNSAVDQSYSPRVIKVKAGTHEGDMTEVAKADIGAGQECGWVLMELGDRAEDGNKEDMVQSAHEKRKEIHAKPKTAEDLRKAGRRGRPSAIPEAVEPFSYREVAAVLGKHTACITPSPAVSSPAPAPSPFVDAVHAIADRWLWCTMIDICICENQFNGRDCHLRGICITGPRYEELEGGQFDSAADGMERTAEAPARPTPSGASRVDQPPYTGGFDRRMRAVWQLR
ncbi:Anaphase promoting complex subunit 10-like protein [Leptomonas seymouri]|uniref:Anaphase promoting complex subunit 10-like protein n=1 Tax=Leptomonas seymouri TaxID=5684 RepID=A0A0N0P2G0_LEPSE|nr:Anaphase promoting complex subunit 10-like protein [Leptomonas seymouri]|eukprot:KPI82909.1 Anaphase promoting complex subunit 10-like protein [Leptomonas seymouri]